MTEMPRVYIKYAQYPIENILKKIYNMNGELLCESTRGRFEYYLEQLLDFVTLIGFEIIHGYYNLETHRIEDILVYYYNEDMVKILGLQFMRDNSHARDMINNETALDAYKISCLQDNRCVVYNIDDDNFKLNVGMSNLAQL